MQTYSLTKPELTDIITEAITKAKKMMTTQEDQHLRKPEVKALTGLKDTAIYRRMNPKDEQYDPSFPKPFKKGGYINFWSKQTVLKWNEKQCFTKP